MSEELQGGVLKKIEVTLHIFEGHGNVKNIEGFVFVNEGILPKDDE